MKNFILLGLVFIITAACGKKSDYVYYDNPPPIRYSKKAYQVVAADNNVDVLWVIDNSGSMSTIQNNIIANSTLFMQDFITDKTLNWKMGLVSTDIDEDPYVGFVNPLDITTVDPVSVFSNAVGSLGTSGSAYEYVFKNVKRFLTDTKWNHFFRPDAHLAIIMVTDEEEQSRMIPDDLINLVRGYLATDKILRFYGAFDFKDMQDCNQWNSAEYKDSPFEAVINKTGGMVLSACDKQFGKGMAAIGKDIVNFAKSPFIVLNERPVTETIKVIYRDKEIKGGPRHEGGYWFYDEYFNKIFFYNLDFIPTGANESIEVSFDIFDGRDRG